MTPAPARLELNKSLARVQHKSPKRSKVFFFFRRVGSVGEHLFCFFLFSFFFFFFPPLNLRLKATGRPAAWHQRRLLDTGGTTGGCCSTHRFWSEWRNRNLVAVRSSVKYTGNVLNNKNDNNNKKSQMYILKRKRKKKKRNASQIISMCLCASAGQAAPIIKDRSSTHTWNNLIWMRVSRLNHNWKWIDQALLFCFSHLIINGGAEPPCSHYAGPGNLT